MQKANGLPSAYGVLEYLQSSGTQVIDTGKYAKLNSKFVADLLYLPGEQGNYAYLFGCANPIVAPFAINSSAYPSSKVSYSSFGNVSDKVPNKDIIPYFRMNMLLTKDSGVVTYVYSDINSLESITTINATSFTENPASHICLFARGNNGLYERFSKCRIYEYWYYEGETLIQHMIPVVRKSDSKPGMYDTVTKTFYTNAGTGEFIIPA